VTFHDVAEFAALPIERVGTAAPTDLANRRAELAPVESAGASALQASVEVLDEVPCLILGDADSSNTIFYVHGGGFRLGSPFIYSTFGQELAARTSSRVVMPTYRLAPEHPFPAGLRDVLRSYIAALGRFGDVVLAGDSAGGGLASAATVALHRAGHPLPSALVLLSPWLDLSVTAASYESRRSTDRVFSRLSASDAAELYLQGHDDRDPLVSPLFADVESFPRCLVMVGGAEVLLDDSVSFASGVGRRGKDVHLVVAADQQHVWPVAAPMSAPAQWALQVVADFVDQRGR
jgi:monoterpene epsilon-lactone hydrolase